MILTYPNAKFYVVTSLNTDEIVMTMHRLMHKMIRYKTVVVTIERYNVEGINRYTLIMLTTSKSLTSKEISTLFSDLKKKKKDGAYVTG